MGHLEFDTSVEREDTYALEHTPTWAVGLVCVVFVALSLLMQRSLQKLGTWLLKRQQIPLNEALTKVKEELMLLGFISLLLTAAQNPISRLCMPDYWADEMLPCHFDSVLHPVDQLFDGPSGSIAPPLHSDSSGLRSMPHRIRTLLMDHTTLIPPSIPAQRIPSTSDADDASLSDLTSEYDHFCSPGHVPVLSTESLHQLHIFIFVMAVVHVFYSCFTMLLGFTQLRSWKRWEEETYVDNYNYTAEIKKSFNESTFMKIALGRQNTFIATRTSPSAAWGTKTVIGIWINSFFRQFGRPVTKADYLSLRLGFIKNHNAPMRLNFYRYMMRSLEDDLKTVIAISGYLWMFVIFFMILNVHGWYTYFWMSFVPVMINLVIGTKLQHIITQLAMETAHSHGICDAPVKPRDELFWFNNPHLLLYLIHFVLFQNAFELAFCIWLVTTFGFDSCFFNQRGFIISRVIVGILAQVLCSYSTLPLYALVSQMGSQYKKAIFDQPVSNAIQCWRSKAKETRKRRSQELNKVEHQKMFENVHLRHVSSDVGSHHSTSSESGNIADAEKDGNDSSHCDYSSHHSSLHGHIFQVHPDSPRTSKTPKTPRSPKPRSPSYDQISTEAEPSSPTGKVNVATSEKHEDENAKETRMDQSDQVSIIETFHFRFPRESTIVERDAPVVAPPQLKLPVSRFPQMSRCPSGKFKSKVNDDLVQPAVLQLASFSELPSPSQNLKQTLASSADSHSSLPIQRTRRGLEDVSASDRDVSTSNDRGTEDTPVNLEKLNNVVDK
ncbi:hypothetical protein R1flu_015512 [Riccia fluitans]|uniref:MLO-like protein n=1 Tax=Riccia fluitans TaxID=41844 RepID=A0ABD1YJ55_9MARC